MTLECVRTLVKLRRSIVCCGLLLVTSLLITVSAFAWPADGQWIAVPKGSDPIHDPTGDAQGARNIVPDSGSLSAAYVFNDGVNIYFRFRLDADPTGQGGQGLLQPYGWGFEIDTDQNAADYEWLMMCDGITSPEIVALRENTDRSHLGDPSDVAERIVAQYPLAGNYRITAADTCYDNQNNPTGVCNAQFDYRDYFLDYKIPYSVFKAATGITDTTLIRFFVGSSSAANNLTENGADLVAGSDLYAMASDYVTSFGTVPSTMTFYNGTVRFVSDLNGAFDRNVALSGAPGEALYLRVDDLDLTGQTNPSETVTVVITSPTGDSERVTLYATGVQGKYTGSLPITTNATPGKVNDGSLYILAGQTASVTYYDAIAANRTQNVPRTDTIYFTAAGTDLAIAKSVDNPAPNEGQTVTFTVTLVNNGPSTVTAATVSDLLPAGLTYLSHSADAGTYVPGTGQWSIGTNLAAGATATLTLRATVNAGTNGSTITNTASLSTSTPGDSYAANNSASASLKVGGTDLRVTKSVDKPLPLEGETVVYSVRVLNLGPANTDGVVVTDTLPPGVTYVSHTASQGTYAGGLWDVGTLANGAGALLKITATVNNGTAGQIITNYAALSASSQPDTNSVNNSASAAIKVEYVDLFLTKQVRRYAPTTTGFADSIAASPTNTVEFRVEVKNNGPHDASGIVVTDTLPVGLTYVAGSATVSHGSYNGATGAWTLGALLNKATATLIFRATVNNGTAGQTLTNQAQITAADQPDSSPGNEYDTASIAVDGTDLRITKAVSNTTPNPGAQITWTVTITNDGPRTATGIVVTDLLPAGLSYVVDKGKLQPDPPTTQGTFAETTGTWTVGTLASTISATLTFYTTVNAGTTGQTITNVAFITSADQPDPNELNNVASASIYVAGTDLNITKTVDDNTPNVGQTVAYTLTVINQGPANATNVVVNDLLPPEVQYASHTPPTASYNSAAGIWTIGNLNSLATMTLVINATVLDEDSHLTITNTATVSATQADQDPTDNIATADIHVNATDLEVLKVVSSATPNNANPYEGYPLTYTVTVTNKGSGQATSVEVEDLLPAGLTYISHTASQGVYAAGLWIVGTLNGSGSGTLAITVRADNGTAGSTIANTASLYHLEQIDTVSTNNSASVNIVPQTPPLIPSLTFLKLSQVERDPVNGLSSPAAIPGADILYTLQVTNFGPGPVDNNSLYFIDPLPANTLLYVGDLTPTAVVTFSDLDTDSGFAAPQPFTVAYSSVANCADYSYVPVPVGGFATDVCRLRINMVGTMNGAVGGTTPDFDLIFRTRIP